MSEALKTEDEEGIVEAEAEAEAKAEKAVAEEDMPLSSYMHPSFATEKSTNNSGTQQQQQQTTPCSIIISLTTKKTLNRDENLVMVDKDNNLPP